MTAYVFDASVLAALYVREDASAAAEAALGRLTDADQLHTPDFALLEVANVLWKRVCRRELSGHAALAAINDMSSAAIHFHPTGLLAPQAVALAIAHGFTAYDASYVALATRVGGTVVTNDGGTRQRGIEAGLPVIAPNEMT